MVRLKVQNLAIGVFGGLAPEHVPPVAPEGHQQFDILGAPASSLFDRFEELELVEGVIDVD